MLALADNDASDVLVVVLLVLGVIALLMFILGRR